LWLDTSLFSEQSKRAGGVRVYRWIDVNVYYHQQYLAKNPHGYCPDHL
jgi:hypothetical protein